MHLKNRCSWKIGEFSLHLSLNRLESSIALAMPKSQVWTDQISTFRNYQMVYDQKEINTNIEYNDILNLTNDNIKEYTQ